MMGNAFSIVFFFIFIGEKYMNPGYLLKWCYFIVLFCVQLFFIIFFTTTSGIAEIAPFTCSIALSFLINRKEKNRIKSLNIAFSILIALTVIVVILATLINIIFPNFDSIENDVYNAVIAICVFASAFLLRAYRNFFFNYTNNMRILMLLLLLKILAFIFIGIIVAILSSSEPERIHYVNFGFTGVIIMGFFILKTKKSPCTSQLLPVTTV